MRTGPIVPPTAVEPPPRDEQINPLAEFAAKGTQSRELKVAANTEISLEHHGARLVKLEAMHTVGSGISVTTEDWFLKCTFDQYGPPGAYVDLSTAHLEKDGKQFPFARDAQAASKLKPLVTVKEEDTHNTVVGFFEVPKDALGPGLMAIALHECRGIQKVDRHRITVDR